MSIKRVLAIAGLTGAIGATSLLGWHMASAADANGASLVDKIAERFSLNKDEVQTVFDEFHQEKQAEHQQRAEDNLQKAVDAGKLTAEQRDLILQKMDEMQSFMESLKDKTPAERKDALKQKHDELKQWAEDNTIPAPFGRMFGPGHRPGPMNHDDMPEMPDGEIGADQ